MREIACNTLSNQFHPGPRTPERGNGAGLIPNPGGKKKKSITLPGRVLSNALLISGDLSCDQLELSYPKLDDHKRGTGISNQRIQARPRECRQTLTGTPRVIYHEHIPFGPQGAHPRDIFAVNILTDRQLPGEPSVGEV